MPKVKEFMDPDYLALLKTMFETEDQRTGVLWNYFRYGVSYIPEEEVWVDAEGNIVDRDTMLNPDYVPATEGETTLNPKWERWNEMSGREKDEYGGEPEKWIVSEGTPAQGDEYITDPTITRTTIGEIEGYDPDAITSESDLVQMGIQAQGELLPKHVAAEEARLETATEEQRRALEIIEYGRSVGLSEAEIDAQLAQAGLSKTDANYARELIEYRQETGVDKLGIDVEGAQHKDVLQGLEERAPVRAAMYLSAMEGLDTEKYGRMAGATASQAYDASKQGLYTNLALRGVGPGETVKDDSMQRAALISQAKTHGRNWAEQESFNRLNTALNTDTMGV